MGLTVVRNVDPATLFTGGNYDAAGFWLASNDGLQSHRFVYYDRLDFFVADAQRSAPPLTSRSYTRIDPLMLQNTGTLFTQTPEPGSIMSENCIDLAVDNWDRLANRQRMYVYANNGATGRFHEVNPLLLNQVLRADVWPNVGASESRGIPLGTIGHYRNVDSNFCFFEDWGYAVAFRADVRDVDNVEYANVMALINLATGYASIVPVVTQYSNTSPNKYTAPALFGQTTAAIHGQFVPDDLNTADAPRGSLWIYFDADDSPSLGSAWQRGWVKEIDWNPLNVPGTPTRVHLRERILTAYEVHEATGAALDGIYETALTSQQIWYHPPSNQLILYSKTATGLSLDPNESKFLFLSAAPAATAVTEPSRMETIATGKTVAFGAETLGSIGELVGGVDVGFQLRRVSSVDEVLPTTPTPGETVLVANGPIHPLDAAVSPVIVKENGVALTETTHYTVNRATGQITFVSPKPLGGGAIYTATYRHFDTPVSPPHGTLLVPAAVSGIDGVAVTEVRYAEEDPVPDRWDRLDSSLI